MEAARADGSQIAFVSDRAGNLDIYLMDADGSNLTRLTDNPAHDRAPAWSPDGQRIAFISERDGAREVYVMNADGSDQTNLTHGSDVFGTLTWSPDGRRIAFAGGRSGNLDVYVMNADGSGVVQLTSDPANDLEPDWSRGFPDPASEAGSRIAFTSNRGATENDIFVMNPDGSDQTQITFQSPTLGADWSPDGRRLAMEGYVPGTSNSEIWAANADGSGRTRLTNNPVRDGGANWTPDGARIAFHSEPEPGNLEIYLMNADGTGSTRLTISPGLDAGPAWRPVESLTPEPLLLPSGPALDAGAGHVCALDSDGVLSCWGLNTDGQATVPAGLGAVAAVSAGDTHTCVVNLDRTVSCWGNSSFRQATVPAGLTGIVGVSAASYHTCALRDDRRVICWGYNFYGQATAPSGLTGVLEVTTGFSHSCARTQSGMVTCWGNDESGQSGVPAGLSGIHDLAAGVDFTCALKADGTVTCWGDNRGGQTSVPAELTSAVAVSAGNYHTCALLSGGTVTCWGRGGTTVPSGLGDVVAIAAGGDFTCALKADGSIACWGDNTNGQTEVPDGLNLNPQQSQVISFTSTPPSPAVVGGSYAVSATGGGSGNPVTFTVSGSCSIDEATVALTGAGSCTVTAHQLGSTGYLPADDVEQSFAIGKATATIVLTDPRPAYDGTPKEATVELSPANLKGLKLSYSQGGIAVVDPTDAGVYQVLATLTNNAYEAEDATGTLTILQASPVIHWAAPAAILLGTPLGNDQLNATATGVGGVSLSGGFTYTPGPGTLLPPGSSQTLAVAFAPADGNYSPAGASVTIAVHYDFTGFFKPVDNPPAVNRAKPGSTILIKFSLAGDQGLGIFSKGVPTANTYECGTDRSAIKRVIPTSHHGLTYDRKKGVYEYDWTTEKSWAGTCLALVVSLVDGTRHEALFQFGEDRGPGPGPGPPPPGPPSPPGPPR